MLSSDQFKPIYIVLPIVVIGVLFFLAFYLVNLQRDSTKACVSNPNLLCEQEYNEIIGKAKERRDLSICEKAKAYIKYERVGIAGERRVRVSKEQAESKCIESVREKGKIQK